MKTFKDILKEAFTEKDFENIIGRHRGKVASSLKGPVAAYVDALEKSVQQIGSKSTMSAKDLRDIVTQSLSPATQVAVPGGGSAVPSLSTLAKQDISKVDAKKAADLARPDPSIPQVKGMSPLPKMTPQAQTPDFGGPSFRSPKPMPVVSPPPKGVGSAPTKTPATLPKMGKTIPSLSKLARQATGDVIAKKTADLARPDPSTPQVKGMPPLPKMTPQAQTPDFGGPSFRVPKPMPAVSPPPKRLKPSLSKQMQRRKERGPLKFDPKAFPEMQPSKLQKVGTAVGKAASAAKSAASSAAKSALAKRKEKQAASTPMSPLRQPAQEPRQPAQEPRQPAQEPRQPAQEPRQSALKQLARAKNRKF